MCSQSPGPWSCCMGPPTVQDNPVSKRRRRRRVVGFRNPSVASCLLNHSNPVISLAKLVLRPSHPGKEVGA